ncbi:iron-containing alcohol dehydrogenase [bacterium]|nr:iron-containing alcohol dehydrogenase [bacterium]
MAIAIQDFISAWPTKVRPFIEHRQVLVILDPAVEASFEIIATLNSLGSADSLTSFMEFSPNPTWDSLNAAMAAAQSSRAECVLAIGGGTAMDLAKLTATALQMGGVDQLWAATESGSEVTIERSNIDLIAIPTTAGTGAEVTRFAVLYRDGIKCSLSGDALKPDAWALDPSLLASLPRSVIADAGLDAVCQAMESLWSVRSTSESEDHAQAALGLAIEHLETAVHSSDNDSITGMQISAHLAGKAINLTTTTAPHALSYGLTSLFGIPHGRAVAILFGQVFRRNMKVSDSDCTHPAGSKFVRRRLEEIAECWGQTCESFPAWWEGYLSHRLQLPSFNARATTRQLDQLNDSVNANRLANNPLTLMRSDINEIYQHLFDTQATSQS